MGNVLTFGLNEYAQVRAKYLRLRPDGGVEFMVRYGDSIADCRLQTPGIHQVRNALAAIAASLAAGVPLEAAARALSTFTGIARRFTVHSVRGITIIDDAYNANPTSFASALDTLKLMPGRRKFVLAGDMLELGENTGALHEELGRQLAECELSGLYTVGEMAAMSGAATVKNGLTFKSWVACPSPESAATELKAVLHEGDTLLVKGSHGVHLERAIEALTR